LSRHYKAIALYPFFDYAESSMTASMDRKNLPGLFFPDIAISPSEKQFLL